MNKNCIQRLCDRMRWHMTSKSNAPQGGQGQNSRCSRDRHKDIHLTGGDLLDVRNIQEKSAEAIVPEVTSPDRYGEDSRPGRAER